MVRKEKGLPLPEEVEEEAFRLFCLEAYDTPGLLKEVDRLNGHGIVDSTNAVALMVDAACGKDHERLKAFVEACKALWDRLPISLKNGLRLKALQSLEDKKK